MKSGDNIKIGKMACFVLLAMTAIMLLGCNNEKEKNNIFDSMRNVGAYVDNTEETTSYVQKYQYSEGYEGITSITNEDYYKYINIDLIDKYLTGFSGAVLIAVDDTIVYASGYGYADEAAEIKADMNTTYKIGDVSMAFTAEAIYSLCNDGLLELNTKISKFFPDIAGGKKITVENLLQFNSGLPNYLNEPEKFANGEELKKIVSAIDDGTEDIPRGFLLDYLSDVEFNFEPGTNYAINYTDYYLLGIIIELVSGMSYEDYIYEYVLLKNQMRMSNAAYDGAIAKPISSVNLAETPHPYVVKGVLSGNSNVIEMHKWLRHVYSDVYYDYGAMLRNGTSGYAVKEGTSKGYVFVADTLHIKEYTEDTIVNLDNTSGVIYFIFVSNDVENYSRVRDCFENVYRMVVTLQGKLRTELEQ